MVSLSKGKQDNTNYYKSKDDLPIDVSREILAIYQSPCKFEISDKCLHGRPQNANESFNGVIWNRVRKATHIGLDVLSVGVSDAIAHFNNGDQAVLDIMKLLKIDPNNYMKKYCNFVNERR